MATEFINKEKKEFKIELQELQKLRNDYLRIVNAPILLRENCIVKVAGCTIGARDIGNGKCETRVEFTSHPTQWVSEAAEQIARGTFTNNVGVVKAEVMYYKDWYREKLKAIESAIDLLNN